MTEKWKCPDCETMNPSSREICYKRGCNGMTFENLRKLIALFGQ